MRSKFGLAGGSARSSGEHSQIRGVSESPHCVLVSIGLDAVAGLGGLGFTIRSVLAGRVHRITRAATTRTDLHMLQDAPGGLFVVLDEAPMGSLLPKEHVLLVAVQHVNGTWVLRGMRMGAYFSAIRVEATDAAKYGSVKAALLDAQQLAVGIPAGSVALAKPRRRGATETTKKLCILA